jgi:hypothetical protein
MHKIINAFYDLAGNCTGGNLHIVTDDFNVETHHVEWCRDQARQKGDQDGVFLAELLLQFTEAEREKIVCYLPGFTDDEPQSAGAAAAGGSKQTSIER